MPLYRALRDVEVSAGNMLIPKSQEPFRAHPRLPLVLPFTLGEREEHAVREHQWDSQYPTRGVSCTTDWKVAVRYAAASKTVVAIDEAECERLGIRRYRVRDCVPLQLIVHPDDEEVILVSDCDGALPKAIVIAAYRIASQEEANQPPEPIRASAPR